MGRHAHMPTCTHVHTRTRTHPHTPPPTQARACTHMRELHPHTHIHPHARSHLLNRAAVAQHIQRERVNDEALAQVLDDGDLDVLAHALRPRSQCKRRAHQRQRQRLSRPPRAGAPLCGLGRRSRPRGGAVAPWLLQPTQAHTNHCWWHSSASDPSRDGRATTI